MAFCVATIATALAAMLLHSSSSAAQPNQGEAMTAIRFVVNGEITLDAMLDDSRAGHDFAAMLPLEVSLSDYHGVEKVSDLPRKVDDSKAPASYEPGAGDITSYAPWGNLAIFTKPFQKSRGLVRLGQFDGPIDALVQDGDIPVRIERAD